MSNNQVMDAPLILKLSLSTVWLVSISIFFERKRSESGKEVSIGPYKDFQEALGVRVHAFCILSNN